MQLMMPLPWPNVVLIIAHIFSLSGDIAVMLTCFLVWMDDAPDTGTTERARISKCNFEMQVHCLPCCSQPDCEYRWHNQWHGVEPAGPAAVRGTRRHDVLWYLGLVAVDRRDCFGLLPLLLAADDLWR